MKHAASLPDVVSAMSDPRLFGPMFPGSSWDNWRAVLRGAFALPMSPPEIEFFRSVTNREPPTRRVKELDIVAGRRSGKDSVTSAVAAYAAVTFQPFGKVRPGERPLVMLLGADRTQARSLLNYIKGYFAEIAPLKALVERETLDGLELRTGIDIVVSTADYKTTRGRTVLLAVFNETAFWPSETSASPDIEVFRAVQPAMATLGDEAMLIMISSAHRRSGLLYDRWAKFYGVDNPDTLVVHAKTRELNPLISDAIIASAMADDPEAAAAEYNSAWRDDLAGYITRPEIETCVDRGITERAPQSGRQYMAWIDASSGAGKDSMCCAVGHKEGDNCIVDAIIEIKPPFSPPDAVASVSRALRSYFLTRVTGDRWGLGFVASEFARHGITLDYSDKNSSETFREALPIIRSGRARLPDSERMIGQFCNLERRALSGGSEKIGHPERGGHHDDLCLVVAGCLVALAAPMSAAEGWVEFIRWQVEGVPPGRGFNMAITDVDDIRAAGPEFGFSFSTEPLLNVVVPPPISAEVGMLGRTFRRMEGKRIAELTRGEAREWLRNPVWRSLNVDLARQLGLPVEDAQ